MNKNKIKFPDMKEVAYHASINPSLDFFFSMGRLHISRSPTIHASPIVGRRLPVKGTASGQSVHTIADWQPSDSLEVI